MVCCPRNTRNKWQGKIPEGKAILNRCRFLLPACLLLISCNGIRRITVRIEEQHNALYAQKALFVYNVEARKVYFTNPTYTRCYFLKGKRHAAKWAQGDTMIIEDNLEEFYSLKFDRNCDQSGTH
jgi:hypothetical protein